MRGYLTFGHTINVPPIAESYATHTRSSIGGFKGRKLLANDVITVKINNDFKKHWKDYSFTGRFIARK